MSTQFTPGPWQRSGVRVKLGEHACLAVGPDSFSIAFLPIGRRPNEQAGAIADAKLIAAAPSLYEAARLWAEYDGLLRKYSGPQSILFDGDAPEIDAAYDRARDATFAAIELARGDLAEVVGGSK